MCLFFPAYSYRRPLLRWQSISSLPLARIHMPIPDNASHKPQAQSNTWWAPLWRGLVVPQGYKHYKAMGSALLPFSYLLLHADRKTGRLIRKLETISKEMGINQRTIHYWLGRLRKHGYINTKHIGRSSEIFIQKWKPLQAIRKRQLEALKRLANAKAK